MRADGAQPLIPGAVAWAELGMGEGREQAGRRPVLVLSSLWHLRAADSLVTVVPCTTRQRGWINHVALSGPTGLGRPSLAMTEQVRTLSRNRLVEVSGCVDSSCLQSVPQWVRDWLA